MAHKTLLVIVPDRVSDIVRKGEYIPRYYNPGDLFDEVHLLMTNDDRPDVADFQKTVGRAKLCLHSLPAPLLRYTLGWQPYLLKEWIKQGIELAKRISPHLVRTHNNFIEGYLAKEIKDALGIPYVISLHGVWDRDELGSTKERIIKIFRSKFEKISIQHADAVIAVYKSILRYANKYGAKNIHLVYNIIAGDKIERKRDYRLSHPPKLVTVNRQTREKNPENIIRAIKDIDCCYLIVGDGDYHEYLRDIVRQQGNQRKIEFAKAIPNEKLCRMLMDFDMMVLHCDYWGMPKTVIEAALAGLPIMINRHPAEPIPEYEGDWVLLNENTPKGYRSSILSLIENEDWRIKYGQQAYQHAKKNFDPQEMENKVVEIYRQVMGSQGRVA